MKFCEHCATKVGDTTTFCPACGRDMEKAKESIASMPPAPCQSSVPTPPSTNTAPPPTNTAPPPTNTVPPPPMEEGSFILEPVDNSNLIQEIQFCFDKDKRESLKSKLAKDFGNFQRAGASNLVAMKVLKKRARGLEFSFQALFFLWMYTIALGLANMPYAETWNEFQKNSSMMIFSDEFNWIIAAMVIVIPSPILNFIVRISTGDFIFYHNDEENKAQKKAIETLLGRNKIFENTAAVLMFLWVLSHTYQTYAFSGNIYMAFQNFLVLLLTVASFSAICSALRWWLLIFWWPVWMLHLVPISRLVLSEADYLNYLWGFY